MCGRYVLDDPALAGEEFRIDISDVPWKPNYNVAPMQQVMVVHEHDGIRKAVPMQWQLIPHWSKTRTLKYPTINARAEGIVDKPTWRSPFRNMRCIIVNSGFIEWKKLGDGKQPYLIKIKDKRIAGFAGLFDTWLNEETGEIIESCAIITTSADEVLKPIHDRMPVFLHSEEYDEWLDPENHNVDELQNLLRPYPSTEIVFFEIDRAVGNVRNNSPEFLKPLKD
ncbi:MAG: SOS response-associated peptidase [Pyrinomonadaceae bacterium]